MALVGFQTGSHGTSRWLKYVLGIIAMTGLALAEMRNWGAQRSGMSPSDQGSDPAAGLMQACMHVKFPHCMRQAQCGTATSRANHHSVFPDLLVGSASERVMVMWAVNLIRGRSTICCSRGCHTRYCCLVWVGA